MGIHAAGNRYLQGLVIAALALASSGCGIFRPEPPTPTPPPTATPLPTATQTPVPSATPTPLPTLTPSPTPEPGCAVEWSWVNDRLEISNVDITRMDGLMAGDVVLTIEGRLSLEVILEAEKDFGEIDDPVVRRARALEDILTSNHVILLGIQHMEEPFYYFNLHPNCH